VLVPIVDEGNVPLRIIGIACGRLHSVALSVEGKVYT
jgi:alpha-tubulin suppressor-like RCC1 family protein